LLQTVLANGVGTAVGASLASVLTAPASVTGGAGRSVIATGSGYIAAITAGQYSAALVVDSIVVDVVAFQIGASTDGAFSLTFKSAIAAGGSHTVDLQVIGPGASAGTSNNCSLVAMVVNV
jgi:hypothetical protein